jgi:hypothetical protein
MTFTEQQIEWIVMEVLRRLGVAGDGKGSASPVNGSELRLNDAVITLRSIEGRLSGITRVVVPQRAVVTPAVKDELKQRKIQLAVANRNVCPTRNA